MQFDVRCLCHFGNTSSLKNNEVKQHWAMIVLGWVTAWELLVLLTKTNAGLHCGSLLADGETHLSQSMQAMGKSGLCSRLLACDHWKEVPQITGHLNGAQLCGAMKMDKSCKEGAAAILKTWVRRSQFESWRRQGALTIESLLNQPFFQWFVCRISIHVWDV